MYFSETITERGTETDRQTISQINQCLFYVSLQQGDIRKQQQQNNLPTGL